MTIKSKITVLLTTCDRYDTTLPLCLMSIFNQSHPPDRVVLIDDSKQKKFYDYQILKNMLILFREKNIEFDYYHGACKGAVPALQIGLDKIEDGWVFKIDDDNILSCDTLELFNNNIQDNIGAMSGIIIDKYLYSFYERNPDKASKEENGYYNRIENIYSEINIQMMHEQSDEIKKVEHIYSNYFFKRDLADDYPLELSPSARREDTVFTHTIFRKGYDLIIIPQIKIYHLSDGLRSGDSKWLSTDRKKNELFFIEKLKEWGVVPDKIRIFDDGVKRYVTKNGINYSVLNA